MMRYLQRLGRALFLPVAILPICGILMGLGYALAPAALMTEDAIAQGGYATTGAAYVVGYFLIQAGAALIKNIELLFVIGVALGLAEDHDGTAALAGLVSWLMITTLLSTEVVSHIAPQMFEWEPAPDSCGDGTVTRMVLAASSAKVAFDQIDNTFIGILCGILGASCYNHFRSTKLPDVLAFFSGKRCVSIVTAVISTAVSAVLLFVWPVLFGFLVKVGKAIAGMDIWGVGIYAFLNRLLIPVGLHHALNNVFLFDTIGLGDLTAYWGAQMAGDIHATTGNPISWSVGMYMSGFFPCIMFGIPGAALAMIQTAKTAKRKATIGVVGSAALCAFLCGVTEPFEFAFMFLAFPLYIVYALLYAVVAMITVALGFRAGFCFSAGLTDVLFSVFLPGAQKCWLLLPIGVVTFIVFYLVFLFAIKRWDLKTPGRQEDSDGELKVQVPVNDYETMARIILNGVGGKENVTSAEHCITRLRLEVKDRLLVDEKTIRYSGAAGVVRPGKCSVQVIIGPKVQFVYDEFKKLIE